MPVITRLEGDLYAAQRLLPLALSLLKQLEKSMKFQHIGNDRLYWDIPGVGKIEARSILGVQSVRIFAEPPPPNPLVTEEQEEQDVFIAFNIPTRTGAHDIPLGTRIPQYKQDVPKETWEMSAINTSCLEGDPVIYYYPHWLTPENDSRFNILKSWTFNLGTKPTPTGEWIATNSITIFHRKSVGFNDMIGWSGFPDDNQGETIDIFSGSSTTSKLLVSELPYRGAKNFYVSPSGEITISILYMVWTVDTDEFHYMLRAKKYGTDGTLLSEDDYTSEHIHRNTTDWRYLPPISIAYDGSDFYCTVTWSHREGYPKAEFNESFIHTSLNKVYDYDPVNRVVVSLDKPGYFTGGAPSTLWISGLQNWHDFARNQWCSLDMFYTDGSPDTWVCKNGATTLFTQTGTSTYTGGAYPYLNADWGSYFCFLTAIGDNPDPATHFPVTPEPWNLHYSIGGYQRICTQEIYDQDRPLFDQVAVFSQYTGTLPDTTTVLDNYYRPMVGDETTDLMLEGGQAKWTTNGLVLMVKKTKTTTTVES